MDELIAKYLSGEAMPDEAMALDEWKQASSDHQLYFNECANAFRLTGKQDVMSEPDTDALYKRTLSQLQLPEKKAKLLLLKNTSFPLKVAATLLIVSAIGISVGSLMKNNQKEFF